MCFVNVLMRACMFPNVEPLWLLLKRAKEACEASEVLTHGNEPNENVH